MAISEDTAALVAAQLTLAWVNRLEPINGIPAAEQQVLDRYLKFRDLVLETDIKHLGALPSD